MLEKHNMDKTEDAKLTFRRRKKDA